MLPPDILSQIVFFSGDRVVASTLKRHVSPKTELFMKTKRLIYGQIQSGKTAYIMDIIKNPTYKRVFKLVMIQNSILVLEQYKKRLREQSIDFQVINNMTKSIKSDVIIIMKNKYRLAHYNKLGDKPTHYIIIMDESDMYRGVSSELKGTHALSKQAFDEFYVTATPLLRKYEAYFNEIVMLKPAENYYGLERVVIDYTSPDDAVERFMRTTGMMLVNAFSKIQTMKQHSQKWSQQYPDTPIILLSCDKIIFLDKQRRKTNLSLSKIIDSLTSHPRILFVANRLSMRGLSYTSSDYSRHLTHQYSDLRSNVTNGLQRLRILGNYSDGPVLKLSVPETNARMVEKVFKGIAKQLTVSSEPFTCLF